MSRQYRAKIPRPNHTWRELIPKSYNIALVRPCSACLWLDSSEFTDTTEPDLFRKLLERLLEAPGSPHPCRLPDVWRQEPLFRGNTR